MSVVARWRFSMAARRFVPDGVMRAVRFAGVFAIASANRTGY
jgi:hypothetical protein